MNSVKLSGGSFCERLTRSCPATVLLGVRGMSGIAKPDKIMKICLAQHLSPRRRSFLSFRAIFFDLTVSRFGGKAFCATTKM